MKPFMPSSFGRRAFFCHVVSFLPGCREPWVSAPNLLTKFPAIFENGGTHGRQTAFLAHSTYKSLFERLETGTGAGVF